MSRMRESVAGLVKAIHEEECAPDRLADLIDRAVDRIADLEAQLAQQDRELEQSRQREAAKDAVLGRVKEQAKKIRKEKYLRLLTDDPEGGDKSALDVNLDCLDSILADVPGATPGETERTT